jgi:hypothetical protein
MNLWHIKQGTSSAKVRAATIDEAKSKAATWGFSEPESVVLAEPRPSSVENLLTRSARKASERRFSGEAISGWGAL